MVIIPTELISDNGIQLKEIVIELARLKGLDASFIDWVNNDNDFCSSLVDCIVPGKLPASEIAAFEQKAGYADGLAIMSEPYRLWAINLYLFLLKILAFLNQFQQQELKVYSSTNP
jgi:tagaturonate reductase